MLKGIIGGAIAGGIGAAVWAAIAYFTGYELAMVAWGIGGFVGVVAAAAAGKDKGDGLGVIAALIAVLAILGGKYGAGYALVQKAIAANPPVVIDDALLMVMQATEVAEEWEQSGKTLSWPAGHDLESAEQKEHFPADVWTEATKRWDATPTEERERIRTAMVESQAQFRAKLGSSITWDAFKASFSAWDALFIGLALFTAFRLGSGGT